MPKLEAGMQAIDFTFDTPWSEKNKLSTVLGDRKTILIFYRFYGCRVCLLDLSKIIKNYEKFTSNNTQVLVVLQTEPEVIRQQDKEEDIPVTIVCDPEHSLYNLYGVNPSEEPIDEGFFQTYQTVLQNRSKEFVYENSGKKSELMSEEALQKLYEAMDLGMAKIENNGKEHAGQLPATFIIEPSGLISYAHYGEHVADVPNVDELLGIVVHGSGNFTKTEKKVDVR